MIIYIIEGIKIILLVLLSYYLLKLFTQVFIIFVKRVMLKIYSKKFEQQFLSKEFKGKENEK